MPYSAVAALMILTTVLLSACSQTTMAVLDDKSRNYYGRATLPRADGSQPVFVPNFNDYTTTTAASMDVVSTRDLAPPSTAPAPQTQPAAKSVPIANGEPHSQLAAPVATMAWQWPVSGTVSSNFGPQREGIANQGITIDATSGTPVRAVAAGEVAFVGSNIPDYGNMVILRHAGGDMSSYAYADRIVVAKGMSVRQGDTIAYVGQTGRAKTPQLHFAVRSGEHAVDPLSKLPSQVAAR